ncbi:MAG: UDP-N-acetylglucosamine--N-acetylmuramyl-(pentapeptide) pyrophosphoryl-undecaprenol N-acetylglucosamine transferase [Erysipelotrichaceae bacterium]|nr:UDP-N-acetylglucosamine--N-acetylmuramyl-(pentapeptide) pyrophosphoryl-undecaprenol N-acetylglucosamine transferase [Erysipelotrichaceae bacterium]
MKVMIAAGGTGGHIYPAMALAEVLKEKYSDSEIVFFGSDNHMEANVIPAAGYRFYGIEMSGMNSGIIAKVRSALSLIRGEFFCMKMLKKEKPDICVGFGNYISVPFIRAAHRQHIPTMIHEQNSFAGKANRFVSPLCDAAVTCYESNREQMPKANIRMLGNPEATLAARTEWDPSMLSELGLDPDIPFVVFMMGSLGSSSVSEVIDQACALFDPSFQVVIAAGKDNEYEFRTPSKGNIRIVPYVDGKAMLKGCALAVTRAGATTMAEIGAIGCASILIPSPYVQNNHQVYNALELVEKDAAVMIEEKDLTAERLAGEVNRLMENEEERQRIRANAYQAGRREAADDMIKWMEELVNER